MVFGGMLCPHRFQTGSSRLGNMMPQAHRRASKIQGKSAMATDDNPYAVEKDMDLRNPWPCCPKGKSQHVHESLTLCKPSRAYRPEPYAWHRCNTAALLTRLQ